METKANPPKGPTSHLPAGPEHRPRSSQTFCARPGCGLARSGHGFMPDACSNFIQPGSKEAHEMKRARLTVVETPAPDTEEETVETPTLSDAELLADWSATQERL